MAFFISGSLNFVMDVLAQVILSVLAVQEMTSQEMIDEIHGIVFNDPRLKIHENFSGTRMAHYI